MTLQRQTIDIPVGFGLDENTGKPSVQAGKLMHAVDFRVSKAGELETREGYDAVSRTARDGNTGGTVAITAGETCFTHDGTAFVSDGSSLFRYSPALKQLCRVDSYPEYTIQDRKRVVHGGAHALGGASPSPYFAPSGQDDCCEAVYCDGFWVVVYLAGTAATIAVFDATTMARVGSYDDYNGRGRLLADATNVYWVTENYVFRIKPRDVADGWLCGSKCTYVERMNHIEACLHGGYVYVCGSTATGDKLTVYAISTETLSISNIASLSDRRFPSCICADATTVYVFAMEKATTQYRMETFGLSLTHFTSVAFPMCPISCAAKADLSGPVVSAMVFVLGENLSNNQDNPLHILGYKDGDFIHHSTTYHVQPISGIRFVGDKLYGAVVSEVRLAATNFENDRVIAPYEPATGYLCEFPLQQDGDGDAYQARPITRFAKELVYFSKDYECRPRRTPLVTGPNGELALPVLIAGQINGDMPGGYAELPLEREASGIDLFLFDQCDASQLQTIDVCGSPVCSGGILCTPNRDSVSEIGFSWRPSLTIYNSTTAAKTFSAGLTPSSHYLYCAIYTYVDDYGNVQRSEPSDPVTVETGTASTGEILVSTVWWLNHTLTSKYRWERSSAYRPESIEIYRTLAGGTEYHFVRVVDMDPKSPCGWITDCMADAEAATCRTLYTDGNVLENVAPPCARAIARSPSRVAIASGDSPDTIWFSKQIIAGEIPGFHENLTSQIPDGPITALSYLGDCLLIFTPQSIWSINGQGPNDLGEASDFTEPRLISNAIGCLDPRSVVQYQGGVFFRSSQGIHRIDSQLQISFVGSAARDQLPTNATVTGGCALPDSQEIVWSVATSATTGILLVYSAAFDQWLTWSPMSSAGVRGGRINGVAGGSVLLSNGELLSPNGTQIEADSTHRVSPTLTTAWLHLAGIQGFQRARQLSVLTTGASGASATIALEYDYKETPYWSRTWTSDQILDLIEGGVGELEVHLPRQKCEAVRATISFACADDAAPKVQGISLDVGIMPGQNRRGAAARGSK